MNELTKRIDNRMTGTLCLYDPKMVNLLADCKAEIQRLLTANKVLKGLCDEYQAQIKAHGIEPPDGAPLFDAIIAAFRRGFAEAKAESIAPDGMMLVPIEPTKEMMLAAEEAYMPFGDMGMALLCGNLAAAPKQENSNE